MNNIVESDFLDFPKYRGHSLQVRWANLSYWCKIFSGFHTRRI